jgi:hypothetical protein
MIDEAAATLDKAAEVANTQVTDVGLQREVLQNIDKYRSQL